MWLCSALLTWEAKNEITDIQHLLDNPQDAETLFISGCTDAWKLEVNCEGAYKQPMQLEV